MKGLNMFQSGKLCRIYVCSYKQLKIKNHGKRRCSNSSDTLRKIDYDHPFIWDLVPYHHSIL